MAKTCLQCGESFPETTPGRGGNQTGRKFCSVACKDAYRRSERRQPTEVVCPSCGQARTVLHASLVGSMCRRCASLLASAAAAKVNARDGLERFMAQVSMLPNGCWEWTGTKQPNGYGAFFNGRTTVLAHRWSYEHLIGAIPDGLQIDHLCRKRACVNPQHLEPVTAQMNTRRAMRTHCVNGHEFTEGNTYMHDGKRHCRECRKVRNRERRSRDDQEQGIS